MELSFSYITNKIYQYGYKTKFNKHSNVFNFGCPICREGSSLGKKKRGYYLVKENYFICHNCQQTWKPFKWVQEVTGLDYKEILKESNESTDSLDVVLLKKEPIKKITKTSSLPHDCINLNDLAQLNYYKDNKIVQDIIKYIKDRRLDKAINKPRTFYVSLTDKLHKNRLIVPFFDDTGKILFYQSRAIYKDDIEFSRYLSKEGGVFTVFGIDKISSDLDYLFLFEGPIDSMFIKNGLGLGGLRLTSIQEKQLEKYRFHNKIWILDNQLDNKEVVKKYNDLIEKKEYVFCIPNKFRQFKDLNELCVSNKLDKIDPKFVIDNSYTGMQAKIRLKI